MKFLKTFNSFGLIKKKAPEGIKTLKRLLTNLNRQFLHANTLGFIHPKKNKEMIFTSFLPYELEIILKTLRNTNK